MRSGPEAIPQPSAFPVDAAGDSYAPTRSPARLPARIAGVASGLPGRAARAITTRALTDPLIAAGLAALTFVVHSLGYVLSAPFWDDEAWVAVSTKLPVGDLTHVTSVTPIGWTFLLRTVFFGGDQAIRLVPLMLCALSVAVAYAVGRSVPRPAQPHALAQARLTGVLAAVAVLLAPSSLLRNDLKPYTADAFVALVILLLVCRLENGWTRKRLATLALACVLGFLLSTTAPFVAAAAFCSLAIVHLVRRQRRRLADVSVAGAGTVLALALLYLAFYQPHVDRTMSSYWRGYYAPFGKGFSSTVGFLWHRGAQWAHFLGMGPLLLVMAFICAGIAGLVRAGRLGLALIAPTLLVEMIIVSGARKYPLFDLRTSHFFTVVMAVFAAVGVAHLGMLIARRRAAAGAVAVAVAVGLFAVNVHTDIRRRSIPREDVRTATAYVAAHRNANDVILISSPTSWGFTYYWPYGTASWRHSAKIASGFQTWYPQDPRIVVATDRTKSSIATAVDAARAAALAGGGRIWLVRMHVSVEEDEAWRADLARRRLSVDKVIPCSLMLLTPVAENARSPARLTRAATCHPAAR